MRLNLDPPHRNRNHARPTFIGIVAVSLAAVFAALVSQHMFAMQPCPWCILQRVIFLAIALIGTVGMLWRGSAGRVFTGAMIIVFALAGAASAVWQHLVAATSSCNFTLADKIISRYLKLDSALPEVFEARATCADAAVDLLGIPYEFWSLGLFVALAVAAGFCIGSAKASRS